MTVTKYHDFPFKKPFRFAKDLSSVVPTALIPGIDSLGYLSLALTEMRASLGGELLAQIRPRSRYTHAESVFSTQVI